MGKDVKGYMRKGQGKRGIGGVNRSVERDCKKMIEKRKSWRSGDRSGG